jgi:hypothetical protein
MKKLLLQFSVLCLLMPLLAPTCVRSDEFDPAKGIAIQMDVKTESINANATKAGEKFSKTVTLNLGEEFKSRYNIDPSALTELNVDLLTVTFDLANCLKLNSFRVSATFPGIGTVTENNCATANSFKIGPGSTYPLNKAIISANFAPAIIAGQAITVTFDMEAREVIEAGSRVSATLSTRAIYKPN